MRANGGGVEGDNEGALSLAQDVRRASEATRARAREQLVSTPELLDAFDVEEDTGTIMVELDAMRSRRPPV